MANPDAAVRAVRAYRLLPEALVKLLAWGLPFVEVILAVFLLAGISVRIAAVVAGGLLVVFMGAVASAWARGLQIDCGCFGGGGAANVDAVTFLTELGRDTGLLLMAMWLAWRPVSRLALAST